MARTDVKKSREAIRVACPVPGFEDEHHWIKPTTREITAKVDVKSKVKEYRRGQLIEETDLKLFVDNHILEIWANWEGVGIVHDDGRVEDPAACTPENKLILINSRPIDFLLWLQSSSNELGGIKEQQQTAERENFRAADEVPTRQTESQL